MRNYEKVGLRISIIIFLIGIIILYISGNLYSPKLISISEINSDKIGQVVKIKGEISELNYKKNNLFLEISDGNSDIFVIEFNVKNNRFEKYQNIYVTGEVNIYNQELEIIADKIELINSE